MTQLRQAISTEFPDKVTETLQTCQNSHKPIYNSVQLLSINDEKVSTISVMKRTFAFNIDHTLL